MSTTEAKAPTPCVCCLVTFASLQHLGDTTRMVKLSLGNCGAVGNLEIFEGLTSLTHCDLRANQLEVTS